MNKISIRWLIVVLLMFATALSFMDRQILSISILKIKEELNISDVQYGFINSGFLVSYTIMFALGGIIIDRLGSRKGLTYSVGFWSFATLLHSIAYNAYHFAFFRFLLGIGEGGCFPGAVKAVQEWVPKKHQATANGLAIGGSAIGSVVALPLCALLLQCANWRWIFLCCGILGLLWTIIWQFVTGSKQINCLTQIESERRGRPKLGYQSILKLIKSKEAITFIIIRFLLDPIFYFYMFWIPKYLSDSRGMSISNIGYITWIPFMALGIANFIGGYVSDIVMHKTGNLNLSRKLVMGIAAFLTVPIIFIDYYSSISTVIIIMSLAFFAHGLWITNYITSIGDVFGNTSTSSIVGLTGSAGAISSLIINPLTGYIVSYSYKLLWLYAGIMYPLAFVIFLIFIPRIRLKNI